MAQWHIGMNLLRAWVLCQEGEHIATQQQWRLQWTDVGFCMVLLSNTSLISDILFGMCWFCLMGELSPGPVQVLSLEISPLLPGLHQIQPTPWTHSPRPPPVAKAPDARDTGSLVSHLKAISCSTAFLSNCLLTIYYESNKMRGPRGRGVQRSAQCLDRGV